MPTYSADEIIGKTLFAKTRINLRQFAGTDAPILAVTEPGSQIGVVFSYVEKPDGLWWMIKRQNAPTVWAKHNPGWYDTKSLREQGALTTEEKRQQEIEANKTTTDKILDTFKNVGKLAIGAALLFAVFKYATTKK